MAKLINPKINKPAPFHPEKLPLDLTKVLDDIEIIKLISKANMELGRYQGFLLNAPNPMLLISPLIRQEALLSSKLEGTHATLEDFLNYEADNINKESLEDVNEVANYREALYYAMENMSSYEDTEENSKIPLSSRLIKEMHKILLTGVRGANKNPGEYKRFQNYIGGTEYITFTPASPERTPEYISNLENYIHQDEVDTLIQASIIHAQFEMIHPFEDGNGRIGRLLIPLFLWYRNALPFPTFYMSSYFEGDRNQYITKLANISAEGDWSGWIGYFLEGIIVQAKANTLKALKLLEAYNSMKETMVREVNSQYTMDTLDFIFYHPYFKATQLTDHLGMKNNTTVYKILNKLIALGLLSKTDDERNAIYYCSSILSLL